LKVPQHLDELADHFHKQMLLGFLHQGATKVKHLNGVILLDAPLNDAHKKLGQA
jgi:hypothetical protein